MKRVIPLLLALAVVLSLGCLAPPVKATGGKLIAITYDDGPGPYTGSLLDGLKARGVKATFFMVGTNVARYPDLVSRIYREGHQVGNHSYDHAELAKLSYEGVQDEIRWVNGLLDSACGAGTGYMVRPPYGSVSPTVAQAVGAPMIEWSVDPLDWKYRNAETVRSNIVKSAHDGAIVLVHDIHSTSVAGSLAAIDDLQAQGYEFVTVRELFRRRGCTLQNGVQYYNMAPNGVDLGPVAAPTIDAEPCGDKLQISITAQSGAQIYYTAAGRDLDQSAVRYTGPILVSTPCTVKAMAAFDLNGSRSETVERTFTTPVTAEPEIRVDGGELTLKSATPGAEIDYALQGGEYRPYTGPVTIGGGTEISARARRLGQLDSSTARASYTTRGNLFRDVFPDQTFYEAMDRAVSAGYIGSVGEGRYDPSGALQRCQLVTMLYRLSGESVTAEDVESLPFTDVPKDAYYAEAVAWAYEKGIAGGSGQGTFEPFRAATCQAACKIFDAYLHTLGVELPEGSSPTPYADLDELSPWALGPVEELASLGLLSGDGDGKLHPTAKIQRGQAVEMLMALADLEEDDQSASRPAGRR